MIKSRLRIARPARIAFERREPGPPRRALAAAVLLAIGLAGCASSAPPSPPAPAAAMAPLPIAARPAETPRALAAELDARLDQLRRQQEPASDDLVASLERALNEQCEKRARVASASAPAPASPARSSKPTKPGPRRSRAAQARAAAASASAAAPGSRACAEAASAPALAQALAARSPMARVDESRRPVDELYARALELELQLKATQAVGLYREASQRGHAASSERLMALYADGAPGVERDYRVAVFFKQRAVQQGVRLAADWHR